MPEFGPSTASWCLTSVQVLGLASAWLTRLTHGSNQAISFQRVFYLFMALVGAATAAALMIGPGSCIGCGATLSVMVLAATWDFDAGRSLTL